MNKGDWTVARHADVTSYLIPRDAVLRETRIAIRQAVTSLYSGIPKDAHFVELDPESGLEVFRWVEARHWITFAADQKKKWIYVIVIESATIE